MCFASQKKRGGVFDLSCYEFPSPTNIALALGKTSSGFEQHLSESTLCKSSSVYQATTKVLLRRNNKSQTADNGTNWMVVLSEWQNNDVMENNFSEQGREPQNSSYIGSRTWHRTRDKLVDWRRMLSNCNPQNRKVKACKVLLPVFSPYKFKKLRMASAFESHRYKLMVKEH